MHKKSVSVIIEVNQPPGRIIKLQMQMVNGEAQRGCTKWTLICARSINHNPRDSASKDIHSRVYENRYTALYTRASVRSLKLKQVNVRHSPLYVGGHSALFVAPGYPKY